ncbi:hypothetical protein [Rhizobium sp. BK491]|uniref:hypothetical protein n=1 Tax=Rhizobium sp. BK491 TaxID=2587009 RepID=UPI00161E4254|nr:hypothetical protein [Rhizobium sp. BK491]MBB3570782.1 hypothetical protein [Rhizobium sp. BK491]
MSENVPNTLPSLDSDREEELKQLLGRRNAMIVAWKNAQHERTYEELRRKAREQRAFERRLEGKTVRPHNSRTQHPDECRDDVRRRYNRDAMRKRRGKTAETVRAYVWLGDLTEEEKKQRRAERRRASRAEERKAAAKRAKLKQF